MAAGQFKVYGAAVEAIGKGTIDLDSSTFRMVLVAAAYTPSQSSHATWADVSGSEASGTGYTSGGKLLACTVARSGLAVTFDCDDQTWADSTITAKYAVIVKDADANGALASTDALLAYCDLDASGGSLSSTAGAFGIIINASGVFTMTAG